MRRDHVVREDFGLRVAQVVYNAFPGVMSPSTIQVGSGPVWETDAGERVPLWVAPGDWLGDLYAWLERGMIHPPPAAVVLDPEPWQARWVRAIDRELARRAEPSASGGYFLRFA